MAQIRLTALRASPSKAENRAIPTVVSVDTNNIIKAVSFLDGTKERTLVKVSRGRYRQNIVAAEKYGEYLRQTDLTNAATNPYNTGTTAAVAAAGTAATGGTALTAYHNNVSAATGGSAVWVRLPAATLRDTVVILNSTAVDITVAPAATNTLNGGTGGTSVIKAGQYGHFYSSVSTGFVTCKGPYY